MFFTELFDLSTLLGCVVEFFLLLDNIVEFFTLLEYLIEFFNIFYEKVDHLFSSILSVNTQFRQINSF